MEKKDVNFIEKRWGGRAAGPDVKKLATEIRILTSRVRELEEELEAEKAESQRLASMLPQTEPEELEE